MGIERSHARNILNSLREPRSADPVSRWVKARSVVHELSLSQPNPVRSRSGQAHRTPSRKLDLRSERTDAKQTSRFGSPIVLSDLMEVVDKTPDKMLLIGILGRPRQDHPFPSGQRRFEFNWGRREQIHAPAQVTH